MLFHLLVGIRRVVSVFFVRNAWLKLRLFVQSPLLHERTLLVLSPASFLSFIQNIVGQTKGHKKDLLVSFKRFS